MCNKKCNTVFTKTLMAISLAAVMTGCASFPDNYENPRTLTPQDVIIDKSETWNAIPALSVAPGMTGMRVNATFPVPEAVGNRHIQFEFPAQAQLSHLVTLLNHAGVQVVLAEAYRENRLDLPQFDGKLIDLLNYLSVSLDIAYEYRRGTLMLGAESQQTVVVPQNREFIKRIAEHIEELGASMARADLDAGLITYKATPTVMDEIELYLDRATRNAAMVNLQIAVVDVRLDREYGQGLDWSRMMASGFSSVNQAVVQGTQGIGIAVDSHLATLTSGGLSALKLGKDFSLNIALDMLAQYGETRTDQNLILSTIAGAPVMITSGTIIPYVSEVGSTAGEGVSQQTAQTDTVRSGLSVEMTPLFDASTGTVTTEIQVSMSSLVAMRELNAGAGLGSLSQPEMQEMDFTNLARLQPGETVVLGGVAYDSVDDQYSSLRGLERAPVGGKRNNTTKNALFIVVRPTVQVFGGSTLAAMPQRAPAVQEGE